RLLTIALPRIRDFRGLSDQQFDGNGNYTFGLSEQTMVYEIDVDKIDRPRGMDITVVTTATNDEEGSNLLRELGLPFKYIACLSPPVTVRQLADFFIFSSFVL